jgi:ATP-dependent Clp protease, protease subunit
MAKADKTPSEPFVKIEDRIEATLLNSRRIFLCDAVDDDTSHEIIRKLWYLELSDPGKPILFVINSPGGSVDSGFAIWDQVKMISSPVTTLVTGLAASMGSVLSLCAPKNRRFSTPNSRFMIHQPRLSGSIQGQATDLEIQAKEMLKTHERLVALYTEETGKDAAIISKALDRDTWLSAEEAKEFGLLHAIVTSFKDIPL